MLTNTTNLCNDIVTSHYIKPKSCPTLVVPLLVLLALLAALGVVLLVFLEVALVLVFLEVALVVLFLLVRLDRLVALAVVSSERFCQK